MKRYTLLALSILVTLIIFQSCDSFGKKGNEEKVVEIDLLPMYGSSPEYGSIKKTPEQLDADRAFLLSSDEVQPSREQACLDYLEFGWYYLKQGDPNTAMRRANQAWQLDSTNPDVYALFAAILNAHGAHHEALDMLDRAINIAPDQYNLYDLYLSESMDFYRSTGDKTKVISFIKMLDNIDVSQDSILQKVNSLRADALEFLNMK